jgi:hypothetical protein
MRLFATLAIETPKHILHTAPRNSPRVARAVVPGCLLVLSGLFPPEGAFAQANVATYAASMSFVDGQRPEGVSWSATLSPSAHGLTVGANETSEGGVLLENWIQSAPIPASVSWRLPSVANFTLDVRGQDLDGTSPVPAPVRAFIRYSMDRVHWSTWYLMPRVDGGSGSQRQFRATIHLPTGARYEYGVLRNQWLNTSPAWTLDNHEFFVWAAQNRPGFFASEFPFIGYAQVRLEGVQAGTLVSSLDVEGNGMIGGISMVPGAQRRATADDPWFFDLAEYQD